MYTQNKFVPWIIGGVVALIGLYILTVVGLAFLFKPVLTMAVTDSTAGQPAASTAPALQPITTAQMPCPTTGEVKTLTGVDVQRLATEVCAFVWRGSDKATTMATCPSGWVCTWDVVNNIVVVQLGVGQTATIRAGTWRLPSAYPGNDAVQNVCALYQKEKAFGLSENPSFQVRFQPATDGSGSPVGPQSCP